MLYTDGKGVILANKNQLLIGNKQYIINEGNYRTLVKYVQDFLCIKDNIVEINKRPNYYSVSDSLVLLAIGYSQRYVKLKSEPRNFEITFSYNFPICIEKEMFELLLDNFFAIAHSQLIALGDEGDFIKVQVSDVAKYGLFMKRLGCFMRKNDKQINIVNDYPIKPILESWKNYCIYKFGVNYPQKRLNTYEIIYASTGFETKTYMFGNNIIAQGVSYVSEYSKTIYYCIFWWDEKFKFLSPGKYAYVKMIEYCHNMGYDFSMCYGRQKYKIELLKEFL